MYQMGYIAAFSESGRMHIDAALITAVAMLIASVAQMIWSVRQRQ